nr:MAG TPA_asm: hypothetical protein [Caudoviricetes sp.]
MFFIFANSTFVISDAVTPSLSANCARVKPSFSRICRILSLISVCHHLHESIIARMYLYVNKNNFKNFKTSIDIQT